MSKPDAFLLASGLMVDVDIDTNAEEALRGFAYAFLRSGGTLSLAEYQGLSVASRAALLAASEAIEEEKDARVVAAVAEAFRSVQEEAINEAAQMAAEAEAAR